MCDTFVVVRPGRLLFGKNSDRDPNEAQVLSWVPAATHAEGSALRCTWIDIPQVAQTHAMVLSRPFWMWGAEMGANEHGVVIGNEAIFAREPLQDDGLLGMDLVRLGLERAATAGQAKDVICELIARHGQGGRCGYDRGGFSYHNSFLIADADGAWVVESAGRTVVTRRIGDGVYAISNGITLPELLPKAERIRPRVAMASRRRERVSCLARSVTDAAGVMGVLRDHGEGRSRPLFSRANGAMGAPCMHAGGWLASSQTVGSFIAELGDDASRYWATGTAAPCLSVFRPISVDRPHDVGEPTGKPDESLWWRFESVHRGLLGSDGETHSAYLQERDRVQAQVFEADEDAAWQTAERWLRDCLDDLSRHRAGDHRPRWLRRYWQRVALRASQDSRLPWRLP